MSSRVDTNPAFAFDRYVTASFDYSDACNAWQAAGRTGPATVARAAALVAFHAAQAEWNTLDTYLGES